MSKRTILAALGAAVVTLLAEASVPAQHPYLFGPLADLQQLALSNVAAYNAMESVARDNPDAGDWEKLMSMSLVSAIESDAALARAAVDRALANFVDQPIKTGHVPFGTDLAIVGIVYDFCYDQWTPAEKTRCHDYINATVDGNVNEETHVFHNGWYGYKNGGVGVAVYACYDDNARAPGILTDILTDYNTRAVPALNMAGNGGGWAEGYYVNYWSYNWMLLCEVALRAGGLDLMAAAPNFYDNRAIASMFETYPGIGIYNSRRPIPMGDGGGRVFGGDRDGALFSRCMLVNRHASDPAHWAVNSFNLTTPNRSVGVYGYRDFLWRDATVPTADLGSFKLSHFSPGPGHVYARSSWGEDATYFHFKCTDRFTAHQHLDVGHFLIYKNEELVGDGGHYDTFGGYHDVNYHLRTIAHNTMLVRDPAETWRPDIRAGNSIGNDGGQSYDWPQHNGAFADVDAWNANSTYLDIADFLAYEDPGPYVYVAGDCSRAYRPAKLEYFTRQIVFLRPGTFVIFDRVKSTDANFVKTWQLQAMKVPTGTAPMLTITNGTGRLFVNTLIPEAPQVSLASGTDLYAYDGNTFDPTWDTGPAPECRIGISPSVPAAFDSFLHVLTATDSSVSAAPSASVIHTADGVVVTLDGASVEFLNDVVGGSIDSDGDGTWTTFAGVATTPPVVSYTLVVNGGTGDGSYGAGSVVPIVADVAPSGKVFDQWTGDVAGIASVVAVSTTITMPSQDATIAATYADATPDRAPVITSPDAASGNVGAAFSYQIESTNNPTLYGATDLPAGLSVDVDTGLIAGAPADEGTSSATVSATNAAGTGSLALTIVISERESSSSSDSGVSCGCGVPTSAFAPLIVAMLPIALLRRTRKTLRGR